MLLRGNLVPIRSFSESAKKPVESEDESVRNCVTPRTRIALRLGSFVTLSAVILAAYELNRVVVPSSKHRALAEGYRDRLASGALRVFAADVAIQGDVRASEGALVVANHQNALDIAVMLSVFKSVVLSRHDLQSWPLLGRLAKHGDTIFVDRDDRHSGAGAVRAIRRTLRAGRTVAAFPEGTTRAEPEVQAFQPGAFAAARGLGTRILPVGIAYAPTVPFEPHTSFAKHLSDLAATRATRIAVHIGEPMPSEQSPRSTALHARERVQALVDDARESLRDGSK